MSPFPGRCWNARSQSSSRHSCWSTRSLSSSRHSPHWSPAPAGLLRGQAPSLQRCPAPHTRGCVCPQPPSSQTQPPEHKPSMVITANGGAGWACAAIAGSRDKTSVQALRATWMITPLCSGRSTATSLFQQCQLVSVQGFVQSYLLSHSSGALFVCLLNFSFCFLLRLTSK